VHRECLTGDVLRSTACDCGRSLDEAMTRFGIAGRGVIVYLRPAGRARACRVFDAGFDGAGATAVVDWILADLGVHGAAATAEPEPARLDDWMAARRLRAATPRRIAG
jgi:3,4-dihydroxy 2-butanone 4-phosphate synthase / GTP cyclohydrolase II